MPTREGNAMFTLHRYYLTASTLRQTFQRWLKEHPLGLSGVDDPLFPEFLALAGAYYSTLFVAWEGWMQLAKASGYHEAQLDEWWADPLRLKLQGYRNATMHYSRRYVDARMVEFVRDKDSVDFVRDVFFILGNAILAEMDRLSPTPS